MGFFKNLFRKKQTNLHYEDQAVRNTDTKKRIQAEEEEEEEENLDEKILNIFYCNKYLLHRILIPIFKFSFFCEIKSHDLRAIIKNAYKIADKQISSLDDLDDIIQSQINKNKEDLIYFPYFYDEDDAVKLAVQLTKTELHHELLNLSDHDSQFIFSKFPVFMLDSDEHELVRLFLKNQIKIALIKIFTFEKELSNIEKNQELLKILTNAIFKYQQLDIISDKTYDLFLEYYHLQNNQFTFNYYSELMNVFLATKLSCSEFYKSNEMLFNFDIEVLSFDEISDNIISQKLYKKYDIKKLIFSILYETANNYTNLRGFLLELQNIDDKINKIEQAAAKDDLLNNDYQNAHLTIREIDLMDGVEFEEFLCDYFNTQGYDCSITKTSGDQGIDLIAKKDGYVLAIQAKCYTNSTVGNHAVMEAVAGANYYHANQAMVITNSIFTKAAVELAKANNVILWDRQILIEKLSNKPTIG